PALCKTCSRLHRCPEMKLQALAIIAALAVGLPAQAQNAGQISRVQNGASCPGCNLFQADLSYKTLKGRNFSGARLRQSDLSLGTFSGANFSKADLRDVMATG